MTDISFQLIFHPSDFSDASGAAFAHALKLALAAPGRLTILHTDAERDEARWSRFPQVRRTLEQWGVLPPHSAQSAVVELGLDVEKVATLDADPVTAILRYLNKQPHDLIVLATHQYDGLERWLHKTAAEPVARRAAEMTLFIPEGCGFVAPESGVVKLNNVLIPVAHTPKAQPAIAAAGALAEALGCKHTNFTLLHMGALQDFPPVALPQQTSRYWRKLARQGQVAQQIQEAARELNPDLIVMATEGRHGFLDALRGSTTERLVRTAPCPVLAVPVNAAELTIA
jgi:nucleotide-binding universal stress UspA family protein